MDRMRLELMNGKKKFLGESKVKERLYHVTKGNFSKFKTDPEKEMGAHLGTQGQANSRFADMNERSGANIMPVHAQLKNPYHAETDIGQWHDIESWRDYLQAYELKGEGELGLTTKQIDALKTPQDVRKLLMKKGYDSISYDNKFEDADTSNPDTWKKSYIAFHPHQIKSAIGNRGTYDTTNPDITKAKGGSVKEPKNTVKAYKLFRVHPKHPGKLFPLFVNANEPVEMNKWVDAKEGEMAGDKVKSKIGPLAYRPGWHAGDLPVATHIGEKSDPNLTAPDVRPANHVWAEVEMPHDVDWQSVANERGMNPKGKLIARNAHITDQIPKGGHYRYKTNSNMTGNWLIGGAMKVNRVLQDKEVKAINKAAGASDLPRTRPFKAKDYGLASGGVVAPEEFMAEEHVNYKAKGGITYPMAPRGEWYGEGTYDKEGGVMKQVTPDNYLAKVRPLTLDDESRENIDLLKKHIQSGKTLDPLLIRASGKEDGRHRAHAAKELGIKKVPVIDYGKHFKAKGGITHAHHLQIEERPL